MELTYVADGLYHHQHKYIYNLLHDAGLLGAHVATIPFPKGCRFTTYSIPLLTDPAPYRRLIGQLLYLNFRQLDITYGVQQLSQFVSNPCQPTRKLSCIFFVILKASPQKVFSFVGTILYPLHLILILIGRPVLTFTALLPAYASFLVPSLTPRKQRNKTQCLDLLLQLSIVAWLLPLMSFSGALFFSRILMSLSHCLFLYGVIIRLLSTSPIILFP